MNELEKKLLELQAELKAYFDKAKEDKKNFGTILEETKAAIDAIQKQVDAIDLKLQEQKAAQSIIPLEQKLKENESLQRLMKDGRGSAVIKLESMADLEQKTTVTSSAVGSATSGILMYDRTPGIVPAARRRLFVGDLLTSIPTTANAVDYVKVNADISDASPQVEASDKFENAITFDTVSTPVRTIATWIPSTRQVLDDFSGLQGFLQSSLVYAVQKEKEDQILSGDNTGQNLNGLITQATAFDTNLLVASDGWEYSDIVARSVQQVETASESMPDFVALSPAAYWHVRLQKDTAGQYIFGNPSMDLGTFPLFGLTAIRTNALSGTTFLIGSSAPSDVVIRDRMGMEVMISTEHSDYFIKNMVAIRAELRLALVVFRPAAYITGSFTQSPA